MTKYIIKRCSLCKEHDKEHTLKASTCRDCRKNYTRTYRDLHKKPIGYIGICKKCGENKHHSPTGARCKDCVKQQTRDNKEVRREYNKEYRHKNKEKIEAKLKVLKENGNLTLRDRRSKLKRVYNITLDQYTEMQIAQNFKCAICGSTDPQSKGRKDLFIDHCHNSNKVRGLLCSKCNMGLGSFQDSTETLEKAILYLNQFKS